MFPFSGGGYGHDLDKFLQRFPQSSGRLVVQDQAHVIQSARNAASPGLKLMPHDFFTPEPIQGMDETTREPLFSSYLTRV